MRQVYASKAVAALNTSAVDGMGHYVKQKRHIWKTHIQAAKVRPASHATARGRREAPISRRRQLRPAAC